MKTLKCPWPSSTNSGIDRALSQKEITEGFALNTTPVTVALWQATDPSFK